MKKKPEPWFWILAPFLLPPVAMAGPAPVADVHLHYNWDQQEIITPAEAIGRLKRNHVRLAVVSSTPPEFALQLKSAAHGLPVVALYRPYQDNQSHFTWYRSDRTVAAARAALESGDYGGIGELHLIAGLGPAPGNSVLAGLLQLAAEFDVPILLHTETSDHRYFLPVCRDHPENRILWAHAGGLLDAVQVGKLMDACPNVWVEFSARDPMKYVMTPITGEDGLLLPQWDALVRRYPERFMMGTDPVWPVEERHVWSQADTGWDHLGHLLSFHRNWINALPGELAEKIRLKNALRFFKIERSQQQDASSR